MRQFRLLTARAVASPQLRVRRFSCSSPLHRVFQGDTVLLRNKTDTTGDGYLVTLTEHREFNCNRGTIPHKEIIGKEPRELVYSSRGAPLRVYEPTLAEYVRLTPRLVTPIYPSDTNLIVSLLDIHVDTPSDLRKGEPPLEILEAGTGHGALTLHLSRAIHAANPPRPEPLVLSAQEEADNSELKEWRDSRRAIIHTIDKQAKYSKHARKVVEGFRHGIYAGNIDFNVGDVSAWIDEQKQARQTDKPFLTRVILDLPNAGHHLAKVGEVLHPNGLLAVFNPSITQIAEVVELVREHKMPYLLDQVIELGAGTIRQWDVRTVQPRARSKRNEKRGLSFVLGNENEDIDAQAEREAELASELAETGEGWATVCRPKAGQQVVGGGFLGLWRRMNYTSSQAKNPSESPADGNEPSGKETEKQPEPVS